MNGTGKVRAAIIGLAVFSGITGMVGVDCLIRAHGGAWPSTWPTIAIGCFDLLIAGWGAGHAFLTLTQFIATVHEDGVLQGRLSQLEQSTRELKHISDELERIRNLRP